MAQTTLSSPPVLAVARPRAQGFTLGHHGRRWLGVGLASLLLGLFLLSLALGSVNIPLEDILRVLLGGSASKESWTNIILKIRLPQAITAVLAGSALSVSGLLLQTFFRNPLADPYTFGISAGASLGVALVVLSVGSFSGVILASLGLFGDLALVLAASLGAGLAVGLVLMIARRISSPTVLLIMGLMAGYATSALVSLLMYFSAPERVQAYVSWGMGNFGGVTWSQLVWLVPVVLIGLVAALSLSKALNALLLGETYARSMGVNVVRARYAIIATTGLLTGAVTAFCGPIGFLGIIVPHLARWLLRSSEHRALLWVVMSLGASLALGAALIAELPGSHLILPLNAVTALMGAPIVISIVLRGRVRRAFS